jgi:hypothetical protein
LFLPKNITSSAATAAKAAAGIARTDTTGKPVK